MTDHEAMGLALRLARRGYPAPNPRVGCVIVREGKVIGEGWHEAAGQPHAEAMALASCDARGATAYVTLEPCNHHGRTPPCSEALIAAGVSLVVVAVADPNPQAQGGADRLRAAGIPVDLGLRREEAERQNELFLTSMRLRRPFVTVKAAIGLDGRIALPSGESKWITGSAARREGHRLRAEMGAVLVGPGTVLKDRPHLTARIPGVVNPPVRVVLDPRRELQADQPVFDDAAPTWHITPDALPLVDGRFDPHALLGHLFDRGLTGVLVEGGAGVIGSFLQADVVDAIELFIAPKVFGEGKPWIETPLLGGLDGPELWTLRSSRRRGVDVQLSYRRQR